MSTLRSAGMVIVAVTTLLAASTMAASKNAGSLKDGVFTPALPPASSYGPDDSRECPHSGPMGALIDTVKRNTEKEGRPLDDGRLCALAETLLDWETNTPVPVDVGSFLAGYFGLPSPARLTIAITDTERAGDIGERLVGAVVDFAKSATSPRYGLATTRISPKAAARGEGGRASTKFVLALWDATFEAPALPRKLNPGQTITLSGKLLGGATNPKIEIGTVEGKLLTPAQEPGQAFKAEVPCGDRPGEVHVELHADTAAGNGRILTNLTFACGTEPPKTITAAQPLKADADLAADEKRIFDLVNQDRVAAGVNAVELDESVAQIARTAAQNLGKGTALSPSDVVALLKEADIGTPTVVLNPARALTPDSAYNLLKSSPSARSQYLSAAATHGGLGIVKAVDPSGATTVVLVQMLVKLQPPPDLAKIKETVRSGIMRRRSDARARALENDSDLEAVASAYATELAASKNDLPKARDEAILAPLRKRIESLKIVSGAPRDIADFAEEPGIIAPGHLMGVGVAEGSHPEFGKHTVYLVLLIGSKRTGAVSKAPPKAKTK